MTSLPIAAATSIGAVHLSVTDAERAIRFYGQVVGLTELSNAGGSVAFGVAGRELVVLHPGASRSVVQGSTGLYHLAIVVPSRKELARVVARLDRLGYSHSPTDHVMTKSDYLWDPDGNGLEIYAETPEVGTWTFDDGNFAARDAGGALRSGRDPIDMRILMSELSVDDDLDAPMPEATKMGHVHLHVSDLDAAINFYHDIIGFDVMGVAPSFGVGFVSAGGYHHHVGLNIWAGAAARPAPAGSAGLRHFTIELPTQDDLDDVVDRLAKASTASEGLFVQDPSGNLMKLSSSSGSR
ncbi:MAG: VOC family protein [Actinomycetota bacterium]